MTSTATGDMNVEIEHGTLELIPVPAGQKASLEVRPSQDVDIGRTKGGTLKLEIEGGSLGLLIDARGRPIPLPPVLEKRRVKTQEWLWDVGG